MAGQLIPLLGKSPFDFGGLKTSTSEEAPFARKVDVVGSDEATLIVRAHSRDIGSGAEIDVDAYTSNPSVDDPSVDFVTSSPSMTATLGTGSDTALETATLVGALGPKLEVRVKGVQAGSKVAISADVSADLVLKQATGESRTVPILSKRKLDFDSMASPATREDVLVKALDVTAYTEATLLVRVHEVDIGASRELDIEVYHTSPSPDDPSIDFVGDDTIAVATIDGTSEGDLVEAVTDVPLGSHLRIVAKATNPVSPGGSTLNATLSAELVLRAKKKAYVR